MFKVELDIEGEVEIELEDRVEDGNNLVARVEYRTSCITGDHS